VDNLKSKSIKAFIWDFSGKMATQGTGFIVTIFLARLLGPEDFGLIAMIMVIVGIAQVFTDIGLGGALIQRRRVLQLHYSSVFYFNIIVGTILTLVTFFSAPLIGDFYNNQKLVPLTQVISLSFIINAFSSVQSTKLRKELNYAALTKVRFIASLFSGIVGIYLAFYGAGVWSLVGQLLSLGIIYNTLIWPVSQWTPSFQFSFKALKQLWGFGFRMFLSGLLDAIFTRLDFIIIGKFFTPLTLGYFQRAKSLNLMIAQYSAGSLMTILFPVLSKIQNDLPRFQNTIIKSLGIICFVAFLLSGGFYLISEELVTILFSDKWLPSVDYFKILVLSGFGYPVSALLVNVLSSRGNSNAFLRLEIYKKILMILNLCIGFSFGIIGYLYGVLSVTIFSVYLNILFASRETLLPISVFVKPIITQMVISITAILGTLLVLNCFKFEHLISLIAKGTLFTMLYIFISWIFKTTSYHYFLEQVSNLIKSR